MTPRLVDWVSRGASPSSLAVLFSGSLYLPRIAGAGGAGYQRPVRAAEGQDAGIADQVQVDARRVTRDTLPNRLEHTACRSCSGLRKKIDVATLHKSRQKVSKNVRLGRCPGISSVVAIRSLQVHQRCRCD